jgi:transcriptional regulator with XRE-family HTH domain
MTPMELIAIRERLGTTRRELGEAIGLEDAKNTLGKWERGERPIPAHRAAMISALAEGRGHEMTPVAP